MGRALFKASARWAHALGWILWMAHGPSISKYGPYIYPPNFRVRKTYEIYVWFRVSEKELLGRGFLNGTNDTLDHISEDMFQPFYPAV